MRAVSHMTAGTMNNLSHGLNEPGDARKYDNAPGVFMALCVEKIGPDLYSFAHYGEQNGDMMRNPDMVFYRAPLPDGRWYPVSFRNDYVGAYRECVEFDSAGAPARFAAREQRDQVSFGGHMDARRARAAGRVSAHVAGGRVRTRPSARTTR